MYRNIMVATDGSKLSGKAIKHALQLAATLKSRVTAFYQSPEYPAPMYAEGTLVPTMAPKDHEARCRAEADRILKPVGRMAEAAGVDFTPSHAIGGATWQAILAAAKKSKSDVIVMASHGRRGIGAVLLGSETQKVLTHAKIPVIVIH